MPANFSRRVIARLAEAEASESNPHFADDLKIARLTVHYAASGEAALCSPHVLASYMVLGLHPDKVWPAIVARRIALTGLSDAPPKKPAQSVKLWPSEAKKNARVRGSRVGCIKVLDEPATSVHMAAPSSAAYPNPDAPTSGKKGYTYDDFLLLLKRRGASHTVRKLLLDMVSVRGPWPKENGPISAVLCVSVKSLEDRTMLCRSTIQRRLRRAQRERCLRRTRDMNSWLNCPKCGSERTTRECPNPKCRHLGNGFDYREFRRTFTYEIDFTEIERLAGSRSGPIEIPRKPAQPAPEKQPDPPATAKPAAEYRRITRDERAALFSTYLALKKTGMAHEAVIAEIERQFKGRYSTDDIDFAVKIVSAKSFPGGEPKAERQFPPDKCKNCDSVLEQNRGPGPRLICPKCKT